jgi:hypothetical protein
LAQAHATSSQKSPNRKTSHARIMLPCPRRIIVDKRAMKSIILLSGPVGAGKTTVSQELVALSPPPIAYIEGDRFWPFIAKSAPQEPQAKTFKMTMTAMLAAAIPYSLHGYEVVLDFSIPPWFLETALKLTQARRIPLDYVVLKPPEAICASRASARSEGRIEDYAQYSEFYATFTGVDEFVITNEATNPAATAAQIREALDAGSVRVRPK